jgi:hypothetical protein
MFHKHTSKAGNFSQPIKHPSMTPQHRWIACVALAKIRMPKLAELYLRFKVNNEVSVDETVEAVLSAYDVPTKLKYECPPSSKFGKDLPQWETPTSCFLYELL